jgi:hypothetical protein
MNPNDVPPSAPTDLDREEMLSAHFAQLVMQQTNLALMLLGRLAHPAGGEVKRDLEAARLFIDQLEMLEVKTRGNLAAQEASLLKQSLLSLRMAFVEAIGSPDPNKPAGEPDSPANPPAEAAATEKSADPTGAPQSPAAEASPSARKFSKKY